MKFGAQTIKEKGGLEVHAKAQGIDWWLWQKLWDKQVSNAELGRLVAKDKRHPFQARTMKRWRDYYRRELAGEV